MRWYKVCLFFFQFVKSSDIVVLISTLMCLPFLFPVDTWEERQRWPPRKHGMYPYNLSPSEGFMSFQLICTILLYLSICVGLSVSFLKCIDLCFPLKVSYRNMDVHSKLMLECNIVCIVVSLIRLTCLIFPPHEIQRMCNVLCDHSHFTLYFVAW